MVNYAKRGEGMQEKMNRKKNLFAFASFICFTLVLALIVLLRLFQIEQVVVWYNKYTDTLNSYEQWTQHNGATLLSVVVILFNFALKAVIPWFPISCIMVAAGVLFKWYFAVAINIAGLVILFSIKYFWGRRFGGGNAEKILAKYDNAHKFIDKGKLGSKLTLFIVRLIPCLPINAVSQLYGTTGLEFYKYVLISVAGFSYKIFSYTIIGRNVYDPMSARFVVPFILLFFFSGVVLLSISGVEGLSAMRLKNRYRKQR